MMRFCFRVLIESGKFSKNIIQYIYEYTAKQTTQKTYL